MSRYSKLITPILGERPILDGRSPEIGHEVSWNREIDRYIGLGPPDMVHYFTLRY